MPKQENQRTEILVILAVVQGFVSRLPRCIQRNRSTNDALFGVLSPIAKAGDCSTPPTHNATVKQTTPHC